MLILLQVNEKGRGKTLGRLRFLGRSKTNFGLKFNY